MNQPYPIAKEGLPYVFILALVVIVSYLIYPLLAVIPFILLGFVAFFFRNPRRVIPSDESVLVSPADGIIMDISSIYESRFLKCNAIKISIFLSIFNVHLNRCPMSGEIKYRAYREGQFLPAFKSHASEINEKNFIGIEKNGLKIMVTQITGFIARRIVCWVKEGDQVNRGDLFGLIKFGSCTEIIVPTHFVEVLVRKGDKVTGGETIIGRIKDES